MLTDDLARLSSLVSVAAMAKNGVTYFIEAGAPRPRELIKAINEVGGLGGAWSHHQRLMCVVMG
ncbi:hypothetical protein [Vulcanisaeta distributa]|uniref:hypothetical protein n=1 Tax=Vulcanisaeta distributa TaxID=164451 RepID=UPI001FB333B1|nr:hypothetical protein [Vulcanisaeta distributa]